MSLTAMPSRKPAPADSRELQENRAWSHLAGPVLVLVGAAVLAGWMFDIHILQSIQAGWTSMKVNTALGLVLSGTALWQLRDPASARWRIRMAQACASAAALIALLTLTEYVAGLSLGIDNLLLVNSLSTIETSNPGRMAPNSASALLFGNAALLLIASATDRSARFTAAGSLAIVTLLLGLFGVMGYAGSIYSADSVGSLASMPLHGALAFVLLGAAALRLAWIRGGWRWSLGTPVVALLALSMMVVFGLSLESIRSTLQFVNTTRLVHHTQQVQTALSELKAGVAVSISGERGFVITGREHFIDSVTLGKQDSVTERLRELTADNPQQQARLIQLDALLQKKQDFFQKVVEARRAGGTERAASLIDSGLGQALVDAIYTIIGQMDNEQRELLAQLEAQSTLSLNRTFLMLPIGTLLALGLFLTTLLFLNAHVTEGRGIAAATAASEASFRSLVVATTQIVWATGPDGEVNNPLPSWQAYTGQSDEEIMGSGWAHALHPDDVARAMDAWVRAVETRSLYDVEYRLRRHDGIYRNFRVRAIGVLNGDDSVREWIGTCTDVTDSRKAEAERDRFFSLSLDLMCIANMDGHFLRINGAFKTTLGFDDTEMLSRPFLDFVHPEDQASTLDVMKSLDSGAKIVDFENRYVCKDGSYRWLRWSCSPLVEEARLYAVAHDITERKQVDTDMRQLNAELDRRVVQRTAQLEAANKELEAFSYSVSHDLRAPLRGVDSFSRMVIEDYGAKLDDEGRRLLDVIRSESQRMGQLIDDLLAFSRVGRLEMRLQPIDMTELVQDVIEKLRLPPERQRQMSVDPLPPAYGDRSLIRQVWVNLLSNALKFTRQQTAPGIEVGATIAAGSAMYYVRDNGVGFDPRHVHKLFGVFQRLHSEEEFEGTGVGLALVQRIINRHGGSVRAEGEVNKGAVFFFSLPVAEEQQP